MRQKHPRLNVVVGDVRDGAAVEQSMPGHDAVLCALGMPNIMDNSGLRAKGTHNIVNAMQKSGVARLVCQSALGTDDSANQLPLVYRYLLVPMFMRRLYTDHALQEGCIRKSQLEWVIVRPAALTKGAQTGVYQHGFTGNKNIKMKISRADTVEFMLEQLTENRYLHQMPCLSY